MFFCHVSASVIIPLVFLLKRFETFVTFCCLVLYGCCWQGNTAHRCKTMIDVIDIVCTTVCQHFAKLCCSIKAFNSLHSLINVADHWWWWWSPLWKFLRKKSRHISFEVKFLIKNPFQHYLWNFEIKQTDTSKVRKFCFFTFISNKSWQQISLCLRMLNTNGT